MSSVRAFYGLLGVGTPSGVNVSGSQSLGKEDTSVSITGADVIYSFTITSTAASDVVTLDLSDGSLTKTTGTPNVTRRGAETGNTAGVDFEGASLGSMTDIYAILIERTATPVDTITIAAQEPNIMDGVLDETNTAYVLQVFPLGVTFGGNTDIAFTFADADDAITITVAGA